MSEAPHTAAPATAEQPENLFPTISQVATDTDAQPDIPDDEANGGAEEGEERQMQEIESLCMRCHEQVSEHLAEQGLFSFTGLTNQGTTRMLLTSIPYFKEVVVMSFRCEHCGHRDSEVQSAEEIQRKLS